MLHARWFPLVLAFAWCVARLTTAAPYSAEAADGSPVPTGFHSVRAGNSNIAPAVRGVLRAAAGFELQSAFEWTTWTAPVTDVGHEVPAGNIGTIVLPLTGMAWVHAAVAEIEAKGVIYDGLPTSPHQFSIRDLGNFYPQEFWDADGVDGRPFWVPSYLAAYGTVAHGLDPWSVGNLSRGAWNPDHPRGRNLTKWHYLGHLNEDDLISGDVTSIKRALEHGPVSSAVSMQVLNASNTVWKNLVVPAGARFAATPEESEHQVLIVGWDDAKPQSLGGGLGAWKVRLNYGSGTDMISSGAPDAPGVVWFGYTAAGIGSWASYFPQDAFREALVDSFSLMHDNGWRGETLDDPRFEGQRYAFAINRYTVPPLATDIRWIVNAVDVAASEPDLEYALRVYADFDGNAPTGAPLATAAGSLTHAGWYSIALDADVQVTSGSTVAIWMQLHAAVNDARVIPVSDLDGPSTASAGQNYYSTNGLNGTWRDANDEGLRIVLRGRVQVAPPLDPSDPGVTDVLETSLRWSWTDNSADEHGFKIYAGEGPAAPAALTDTRAIDATFWDHSSLSPNTQYAFQVAAYSANGDSDKTANITTYTLIEPLSGLDFPTITPSAITVRGANTPSNLAAGASGLMFLNATTAEPSPLQNDNAGWTGLTVLAPNTSYTFTGYSINGAGRATSARGAVAWTRAETPVAPIVTTPTLTSLVVAIDPNDQNPTYTRYAIQINPPVAAAENVWVQADGTVGPAEAWQTADGWSTVTVTGLIAGRQYFFGVKARNNAAPPVETGFGPDANLRTLIPTLPNLPGWTSATQIEASRIRWAWEDNNAFEIGFELYAGPGTSAPLAATATVPPDTVFWDHAGLAANAPYAFEVAARNTVGLGTRTAVLSVWSGVEAVDGLAFEVFTTDTVGFRLPNAPTNLTSGTSGILFANDALGTSSGWRQTNVRWESAGLTPNAQYTFSARTRNAESLATPPYAQSRYTLARAPGAPLVGAVTPGSIELAIDPSDGNTTWTQYAIRILPSVEGRFWVQADGSIGSSAAFRTAADWSTVTATGLVDNVAYSLFVKARNGDGLETPFGPGADVTTLKLPPEPPGARAASHVRTNRIRWNWFDQSNNESGFHIYTGLGDTAPAALTTDTAAGSIYFDYFDLSPNTRYAGQVSAFNEGGESAKTPSQAVYTFAIVPNALALSNAGPFGFDLRLGAEDGNPTHTEYAIRILPTVDGKMWVQADGSLATTTDYQTSASWGTVRLTGLNPSTWYTAEVRARNGDNVLTLFGRQSRIRTLVSPPEAPSDPGTINVSAFSIPWTWQDNSDTEAGFKVFVGPGAVAPSTPTQITEANATFWVFSAGVQPNTQYAFQVAATNVAGDSTKTPNLAVYTLASVPLAPIIANPTPNSLDIQIGTGDSNPANTPYAIRVSPAVDGKLWVQPDGSFGSFAVFQTRALWGAATAAGLEASTPYTFRVKARNGDGLETSFGAPGVGLTLAAPPPQAPSNPGVADVSLTALRWTWEDNGEYETGFKLYATQGPTAPPAPTHTTAKNATFWYQSALSTNTQYTMQVAATNATADSAKTAALSVHTAIEQIRSLVYSAVTSNSIGVSPGHTLSNLEQWFSGVLLSNVTVDSASNWRQQSDPWVSFGLSPNTPYTFTGQSRNGDGVATPVFTDTKYTLANRAKAPLITSSTASTLQAALDPSDGNTTATLYALTITHPTFGPSQLQADGTLGDEPVFQRVADWDTFTVVDLYGSTSYTLTATARNAEGIDSGPGVPAYVMTPLGNTAIGGFWVLYE